MTARLYKESLMSLWRGFKQTFPKWFTLWCPLFMFVSLAPLTRWLKEMKGVYIQDLVLPFALAFITSAIVASIFLRLYMRDRFAAYMGALLTAGAFGPAYFFIYRVLSSHGFTWGPGGTIMFALTTFILAYIIAFLVDKFTRKWRNKTDILAKSIFIVIAVAFSIQTFSLLKTLFETWPQVFLPTAVLV